MRKSASAGAVPKSNIIPISSARKRAVRGTLTEEEVRTLKQLVEYEGLEYMAKEIGISSGTLSRICAGWIDRCNPRVRQTVLAFFEVT